MRQESDYITEAVNEAWGLTATIQQKDGTFAKVPWAVRVHTFTCVHCLKTKTHADSFTMGYGINAEGRPVCFACCGELDRAEMLKTGRAVLYLSGDRHKGYTVGNWPGTLKLSPYAVTHGRHNIARSRTDVWFVLEGQHWHGTQFGDWTQILHCKRIKGRKAV